MMDDTPRVFPRHLQMSGFCLVPGGRDWFKVHGLDWRSFIENGIAVSEVEHIDDVMCRAAIRAAMKEYSK